MPEPTLASQALLALVFFGASAIAAYFAYRRRFFAYPACALPARALGQLAPVKLGTLAAFFVFVGGCCLVFGLIVAILFGGAMARHGGVADYLGSFVQTAIPWLPLVVSLGALWFCRVPGRPLWRWLFRGRPVICNGALRFQWKRAVAIGAASVLLAFPVAQMVLNLVGGLIALFGGVVTQQTVVEQFSRSSATPIQLTFFALNTVLVAPLLEEIVFRGLLQTWIRRHKGRYFSITASALIFAAAHFRMEQGLSNISLIAAIFVLGGFLGFLFERERTLLAPITLHALFNGITVTALLIVSK